MNTAIVAVEVRNVYYCVSQKFEGRKLDYAKLLELASEFGFLKRATAYGGSVGDEAVNFVTYLRAVGFETRYKESKKAEWGIGITLDVVKAVLSHRLDTVILVTSNPDFAPLLAWIREQGIESVVIGVGLPKELRDVCNAYIEISSDLLQDVEADKRHD